MSFATLALIGLVALAGPLLSSRTDWNVPVLIGELAAGIAFGTTGFGVLHADDDTFTLLAEVGFALIMFVAGSHVPVRAPGLGTALAAGIARAAGVGVIAAGLGVAVAAVSGTGHAALYGVLMASSSAAVVLPAIDALKLSGPPVLQLLPQVTVADAACIVALPLVIDTAHAARAALGAAAVIAAAILLFLILRELERRGSRKRMHRVSEKRKLALELRINLVLLFALAALAVRTHVSILLAGFSFGVAVSAIGEPRRLARQLFAVTEGFFGPLFFVWLGASLDLRDLGRSPGYVLLGVVLGVGAVLAHAAMRLVGQQGSMALLASAQLGIPVAAATVGTQLNLLKPGEAAALLLGALITIAVAALAAAHAARAGAAAPAIED